MKCEGDSKCKVAKGLINAYITRRKAKGMQESEGKGGKHLHGRFGMHA